VTVRVVVADDHAVSLTGLVMILGAHSEIDVVATATNGHEAIEACREHDADVVVMDLKMPYMDGTEATRVLASDSESHVTQPAPRVLVLTTFDDDESVYAALQAGASGFLLKSAAARSIVEAVLQVAKGNGWLEPSIVGQVLSRLALPSTPEGRNEALARLSPRELEVLALMAQGMTNAEIREHLTLSEATVKTHVSRILMKTGCHDRAQAVALAFRTRLVDP
jgi:DNA-binding NarL/FixJ family response regulator